MKNIIEVIDDLALPYYNIWGDTGSWYAVTMACVRLRAMKGYELTLPEIIALAFHAAALKSSSKSATAAEVNLASSAIALSRCSLTDIPRKYIVQAAEAIAHRHRPHTELAKLLAAACYPEPRILLKLLYKVAEASYGTDCALDRATQLAHMRYGPDGYGFQVMPALYKSYFKIELEKLHSICSTPETIKIKLEELR